MISIRPVCAALVAATLLSSCANQTVQPVPAPVPPAVQPPAPGPVEIGTRSRVGPLERQVIEGTGTLVAPPQSPAESAAPAAGDGFQLNFAETDIFTIVGSVLGDGLGVPYVIDPQVKGQMTLQATRPLARDDVLAALEAALRVHGVVMIVENGVYHIVPDKDAMRRIPGLQAAGQGARGFGIHIVPLQFISAAEMDRVLQPFAPQGGIVRVDEARNLLLIGGTGQEISTLLNVVRTFDVDWLAGMSFALHPLEYVDAKTLAEELSQVFESARSPIAGVVRFVPITRLNTLMVVTSQAKYLKDAETWIKRLDVGATTPGRRIYVYEVQNGKADDLARSLSRILSVSYDEVPSVGTGRSVLDSGSGVSVGTPFSGIGGGRLAAPTNAAPAPSPPTGSASQRFAESSAAEPGSLKIVPNEENNSLLILASPSEFSVIEAALRRLDVLPLQVLIEASIAEVTLTDDIKYGLQFSAQGGDGPVVLSEAGNGAISQQFPGFSYLFTGRQDIRAVLNAIESLTNVRVLSAPKLIVLNNREAQLQVGDQVPITVQSAIGVVDSSAPIVNSVQLRDTGVILRVTPRANKSGRVILEVAQEVSDVAPTTSSGIDSPTIQQRKIASTVSVHDGDTIALGGLIRESNSRGGSGIPYLRKIPVLGQVFGSTNRGSRRTELIVLLTPRVIRSQEESQSVMEELQRQFRGLRKVLPPREQKPVESAPPPQ